MRFMKVAEKPIVSSRKRPARGTAVVEDSTITVRNVRIPVSRLDKVLYPQAGFTKGQVIDYYMRIAPALLPHLRDRPLTMKRYPNGTEAPFFYEKRCPSYRPDWVNTASVWSKENAENVNFCVVNNLPSLVWAANLADLELHTSLAVRRDLSCPTMVVFDLDPGAPADVIQCAEIALWLRAALEKLGLESFVKTSGSKGLQLYIPLNTPVSYDTTKAFARSMAEGLEQEKPELALSKMRKDLRKGKVFVDWSQNDFHKTTVCVYSLRAKGQPTVSTPVSWDEVEAALRKRDAAKLSFVSDEVLKRAEKLGDLFAPVLTLKQRLPKIS